MRNRTRSALLSLLFLLVLASVGSAVLSPPAVAQHGPQDWAEQLRWPWNDRRTERHWPRNRTYDLRHVKIEVKEIDWEQETLHAATTLTVAPLNDGLGRVELDAAGLLVEDAALVSPPTGLAGGRPLAFTENDHKLVVSLDRLYDQGEEISLRIRYRAAHPPKGLYFRHPDTAYPDTPRQIWTQGESEYHRYWFPLYDFPNDKTTSEIIATVPADMTAISNGTLVEVTENQPANTRTFHWKQEIPHSTYLISLIVGKFDRHEETVDALPLHYYVPPGTPKSRVERSFAETPAMVRFFNDYIGIPYPYPKYAQATVENFLWGGMENTSATTLYTDTLHPANAVPNWSSEGLVAHELVHQWWGDLLTCRAWAHIWLNESFATFFTNLWFEHRHGRARYDYERLKDMHDYLCEDDKNYASFCENQVDYRRPIVWPVYVNEMDLFDRHTYPKGGLVLHMLRAFLGENRFREAIHHYGSKFARQPVDTEDLRKAVAEATGQELGWFFHQWVYRAGHPEFHVRSQWDPDRKSLHLAVEQVQPLTELTPVFRVPVEVEFVTAQGTQRFHILAAHRRDDFHFKLLARPTRILFDPDWDILKELHFPKSRTELVDLVRNDPNVIGRIWAAEQLARRPDDPAALEALRGALRNDAFYGVRVQVARFLGQTKKPAAHAALLEALRDPDARVRESAARALGQFRDDDAHAADALRHTIANETNHYVIAAAVRSLARVRGAEAFAPLRAALERDSHREVVRRAALQGLTDLKEDDRALPMALQWSRYGRPPRAREAAIEVLGEIGKGSEAVFNHLLGLLDDPYIWARRSALRALGDLGNPRALPHLEAFAEREAERRLQFEAEVALRKLRGQLRPGR